MLYLNLSYFMIIDKISEIIVALKLRNEPHFKEQLHLFKKLCIIHKTLAIATLYLYEKKRSC